MASPSLLVSEERTRTFPMRHPGGVSLPPVQKLVASIIVALRGNDQIEGLLPAPSPYGITDTWFHRDFVAFW